MSNGFVCRRLPSRFPVGTRYVVEGRGGSRGELRICLRYLEFPDGRHIDLPVRGGGRTRAARPPLRDPRRSKIIWGKPERPWISRVAQINAGWRAPQPPTPHPSGDRPWPFGRRGLLFCVLPKRCCRTDEWQRGLISAKQAMIPRFLLALFGPKRRGARACPRSRDRDPAPGAPSRLVPLHHQVIAMHHLGAAAEAQDGNDVAEDGRPLMRAASSAS